MKAISFYMYLIFFVIAVLVADITVIPVFISFLCLPIVWKVMSKMNEKEVYQVFGINWLSKHFNNLVIKEMIKE